MQTRELSAAEFSEVLGEPMARATESEAPPFDFWPYFEAIPEQEFQGYDCSEGRVDYVYREPSGRYEHVLINSTDRNVFMVLILDRSVREVVGHRLLNLDRAYGIAHP